MRSGRTIGATREKLETASDRIAAHKKIKRRTISRVVLTVIGFVLVGATLFALGTFFFGAGRESSVGSTATFIPYSPTIPVEDAAASGHISARTKEYIGQLEADLRAYGLVPVRAVLPAGTVREVDIYLDGHPGFIKTTIDRGTGVTAEDTDRMLRYLAGQGITTYEYIDVRIDGKAYWK
ncbi:hypothetical protein IKG68_00590 [Candidatus Saccharibacteria bacterium]|nr:hypothetical protein [Candidatus Saccharibacteria bacterium]